MTGDSQKLKDKGLTLIISVGKWGGFYCHSHRLFLGFIAFTLYKFDIDDKLKKLIDHWDFEVLKCKECGETPFITVKGFKTIREEITVLHHCMYGNNVRLDLAYWNHLNGMKEEWEKNE